MYVELEEDLDIFLFITHSFVPGSGSLTESRSGLMTIKLHPHNSYLPSSMFRLMLKDLLPTVNQTTGTIA